MIQNEGPGWRISRDSMRGEFQFLIGGNGWAFELTEPEWCVLVAIISELTSQHNQLQDQLMPEELVSLEIEKGSWWASLDGDKNDWSLQIVFQSTESGVRGFEAHWPKPSAKAVAEAVRTIWDSPTD